MQIIRAARATVSRQGDDIIIDLYTTTTEQDALTSEPAQRVILDAGTLDAADARFLTPSTLQPSDDRLAIMRLFGVWADADDFDDDLVDQLRAEADQRLDDVNAT